MESAFSEHIGKVLEKITWEQVSAALLYNKFSIVRHVTGIML